MSNDTTAQTQLTHTLRNHLNNITLNAELAKMELSASRDTNESQAMSGTSLSCMDAILEECRACSTIIDEVAMQPKSKVE